jgi:NADH-quinone oxidoreductase subunit M
MLWMFQRVIFGQIRHEENRGLKDLSKREIGLLLPLLLFIFWIGIYPSTFLGKTEGTMTRIVQTVETVRTGIPAASLPPAVK